MSVVKNNDLLIFQILGSCFYSHFTQQPNFFEIRVVCIILLQALWHLLTQSQTQQICVINLVYMYIF